MPQKERKRNADTVFLHLSSSKMKLCSFLLLTPFPLTFDFPDLDTLNKYYLSCRIYGRKLVLLHYPLMNM